MSTSDLPTIETGHHHEGAEGLVVRYQPDPSRHDPRWCREGMAISDHNGRMIDTYWGGMGQDSHVLNAVELATVEPLFWIDDYAELDRHGRGSADEWATYAPEDRQRITSQHGLQVRYFIRLGARPDLATQLANAIAAMESARHDVEDAERRLAYAEERVDALRDELRTPPAKPDCDTCGDTGRVDHMIEGDPHCYQAPDDDGKVPCPDCRVTSPSVEATSGGAS